MARGPNFIEIASAVASVINSEKQGLFDWPEPWPHRFRAIEPTKGARLIVEESGDQEIEEVPVEYVANCIVAWLRSQKDTDCLVTHRKAKEIAEFWLAFTIPIPMASIKSVRWQSEQGYTWRRLPWAIEDGPTPTWDGILNRMSNASAFRQWLGSLFFDEAKQHQYVWIHGMGEDGKGSMNDILDSVFGRAYRSKQPPHPGDKFWTYDLIGSRLVVFPDCNAQGFVAGGLFKSLSGGDPVSVEAKGRMAFTTRLNCKFLFLSNEKPNISSEHADMRRIIYCAFTEKGSDKEPKFKSRLWNEAGHFLSRCVIEYQDNCREHEDIRSDKENIEAWISTNDEEYQHVFDKYFRIPHEQYRTKASLDNLSLAEIRLVTFDPEKMLAIVKEEFKDYRQQKGFRDWLYKKHRAERIRVLREGQRIWVYVGVSHTLTAKTSREVTLLVSKLKIVAGQAGHCPPTM